MQQLRQSSNSIISSWYWKHLTVICPSWTQYILLINTNSKNTRASKLVKLISYSKIVSLIHAKLHNLMVYNLKFVLMLYLSDLQNTSSGKLACRKLWSHWIFGRSKKWWFNKCETSYALFQSSETLQVNRWRREILATKILSNEDDADDDGKEQL